MNTYTPDGTAVIDATGKQWAIETFHPMPVPAGVASSLGSPVMYSGGKWAIGAKPKRHGGLEITDTVRFDWLQRYGGQLTARAGERTTGNDGCYWEYAAGENSFQGHTIREAVDNAIIGGLYE